MTLAERATAQLTPYLDVDTEGLLPALAAGFMAPLEICDIARDTDTHIAWGALFDPDTCPGPLLPWLAQLSGDQLLPSDTEQDQRERITDPGNFFRGTVEAIKAEIRPVLTGNRTVILLERVSGNEFAVTIITRTSETPNPAAVVVAAWRQLAPWLIVTFVVSDDPIWDEATLTWDAVGATETWDSIVLGDV
jgi:phage tail P2-like protein